MATALWLLAIQVVIGAFDTLLLPALATWWRQPTAMRLVPADVPEPLRWLLLVMATGVFVSGARDLYSAAGLPHGAWPWATRRPA